MVDERDASIVVNVGTGRGASVLEVLEAARRVTGRPIQAADAPRRAGDPPAVWADTRHAADVLGWTATRTLDDILDSAWRWHSAHPAGYEPAA